MLMEQVTLTVAAMEAFMAVVSMTAAMVTGHDRNLVVNSTVTSGVVSHY